MLPTRRGREAGSGCHTFVSYSLQVSAWILFNYSPPCGGGGKVHTNSVRPRQVESTEFKKLKISQRISFGNFEILDFIANDLSTYQHFFWWKCISNTWLTLPVCTSPCRIQVRPWESCRFSDAFKSPKEAQLLTDQLCWLRGCYWQQGKCR